MRVRALLLLAILAGIYVGAYAVLSLNGSYVSSQTGQVRVAGGGPLIDDVSVWRPRGVRLKISLNAAGQSSARRTSSAGSSIRSSGSIASIGIVRSIRSSIC